MATARTRGRTRAPVPIVARQRVPAQGRHRALAGAEERSPVLRLQRSAGNAAVTALVHGVRVQRRTEPGWGQSQGGVTEHASLPSASPARRRSSAE
jgi:hypothetical protein